jgi:hypothetical protein
MMDSRLAAAMRLCCAASVLEFLPSCSKREEAPPPIWAVSSKYLAAVANGDYPVAEATVLVKEANIYFGRLVSALHKSAKYVPKVADETHQKPASTMATAKV